MKKYDLKIGGKEYKTEVLSVTAKSAQINVNGTKYDIEIKLSEKDPVVLAPKAAAAAPTAAPKPVQQAASAVNAIKAGMPGLITKILVKAGDSVKIGDKVMVMEAMKMENDLLSTLAGVVKEVKVREGENVKDQDILIVIG